MIAVEQLVQIVGAILILIAFVAVQRGWMNPAQTTYQLLNLVGAAVLAVLAARDSDWGFLLLETVWALVSAHALAERLRGRHAVSASD